MAKLLDGQCQHKIQTGNGMLSKGIKFSNIGLYVNLKKTGKTTNFLSIITVNDFSDHKFKEKSFNQEDIILENFQSFYKS